MAPPEAPHTVQVDIYIARRKRVHAVHDQYGVPVFHDPHIMNVFDWLAEQDICTARLTDDSSAFVVTFTRVDAQPLSEQEIDNG